VNWISVAEQLGRSCPVIEELLAHLPALQQQASVHCAQPHDGVPSLEVLEVVALGVQVDAQALEQL